MVKGLQKSKEIAYRNIHLAQETQKEYYKRNGHPRDFQIGEQVWIFTPIVKSGTAKKFAHQWFGPFRIIDRLSQLNFRVQSNRKSKKTMLVHINRMKKYFEWNKPTEIPTNYEFLEEEAVDIEDLPQEAGETEQNNKTENKEDDTPFQIQIPTSLPKEIIQPPQIRTSRVDMVGITGKRVNPLEYKVQYSDGTTKWIEPKDDSFMRHLIFQFEKSHPNLVSRTRSGVSRT